MILLQSHSRFLLQTLLNRVHNLEKAVEVDYNWVEFDDVRYHVQVSIKNPHLFLLSVSLPIPSADTVFCGGLPSGAIEAIKAAYGVLVQILDPPRDGFNLTLKLNLSKLPLDEDNRHTILVKVASIREVVLGAPLRVILKQLGSRVVASDVNRLVALVHRPKESFFLVPQAEKVTVVFPMRFKDSIDIALATSFLQEFVEARRTAGLNNAPPCSWSPSPPQELKGAPNDALSANAGFVTFVIFPRHIEGKKVDRVIWSLSTFHAYVSYHVKCSEGFMHTRMRRRVESLIQALYTTHALSCRHLIVPSQMQSVQGKKHTADPSNGWLVMGMLVDDDCGDFFLCYNLFYCNMPARKHKEIELHNAFIELWKFCKTSSVSSMIVGKGNGVVVFYFFPL